MDILSVQVLLKDGSFEDYEVRNEREEEKYEVLKDNKPLISFHSLEDGTWEVIENPGNVDPDLQERISTQLNAFRR